MEHISPLQPKLYSGVKKTERGRCLSLSARRSFTWLPLRVTDSHFSAVTLIWFYERLQTEPEKRELGWSKHSPTSVRDDGHDAVRLLRPGSSRPAQVLSPAGVRWWPSRFRQNPGGKHTHFWSICVDNPARRINSATVIWFSWNRETVVSRDLRRGQVRRFRVAFKSGWIFVFHLNYNLEQFSVFLKKNQCWAWNLHLK